MPEKELLKSVVVNENFKGEIVDSFIALTYVTHAHEANEICELLIAQRHIGNAMRMVTMKSCRNSPVLNMN
jgi:hypothetical protein